MPTHPRNPDDFPHFDPRDERFLEGLRNLIEFKVERQHFEENRFETHHVYSRSMIDAVEFASSELEGDGWFIESITRVWDEQFFANLSGYDSSDNATEETFWEIVRGIGPGNGSSHSPHPD